MPFRPPCCESDTILLKSFVPVTEMEFSYGKIFIPVTEISVAKTEIPVTGQARPHMNASIFLQRKEWRGEISETEPARLTGLI